MPRPPHAAHPTGAVPSMPAAAVSRGPVEGSHPVESSSGILETTLSTLLLHWLSERQASSDVGEPEKKTN
jgi:hypothetical protein